MKKFLINLVQSPLPLLLVILVAAFLRLYQLGVNPPSLDWDEASLGYNAYSLLKTGKDEFGRSWPTSIRSFEDYKPALYTYLTIPVVAIFGLNEFATRLPSALSGVLAVFFTYFLVKELLSRIAFDHEYSRLVGLFTAGLLAISPWHLQFSRVAFEANVALTCMIVGLYLFLRSLREGWTLPLSAIVLSLSFYAYHSPRLLVPLILLGWTFIFRNIFWQRRRWIIVSVALAFIVLLPFINEFTSSGRARFSSVTVLSPQGRLDQAIEAWKKDTANGDWLGRVWHNRRLVYALEIARGYLDHFNFDFLFLYGDAPGRHHSSDMGMLYLVEAPFILLGIFYLLKRKEQTSRVIFWWFLLAPAASALTTGTPHAVRALFYLPLYQLFTAIGVYYCLLKFKTKKNYTLTFLTIISFGFLLNISYYLDSYYKRMPIESARDWQYGYKEAVFGAARWESEVDQIVMTYNYDQPHIYVLFYRQIDPAWYQAQPKGESIMRFERKFGKYVFRPIKWDQDQHLKNVLFIGTPGEIPVDAKEIVAEIPFPDGQIAFRIVKL